MGSEDLFHKRKARSLKASARRKAIRKPYDNVLIICEGEKTEPYYFEEIRILLDLDSTNIKIDGSCNSSPISIVEYGKRLFDRERQMCGNYDSVFCVFDRDQHESFERALSKINAINDKLKQEKYSDTDVFLAIKSTPAFEYWFLLHYTPSTTPYEPLPNKSVGKQVIDELKRYYPDYKKNQKGFYRHSTENNLIGGAKSHSRRIFDAAEISNDTNPSTNVHVLVEYLENLKL